MKEGVFKEKKMEDIKKFYYGKKRNKREVWCGRNGKEIIYKENALGGKYLITFDSGQWSTVKMTLTHDGIGDTIQEAFADYLNKNKPLSTLNQ